MDKAVPVKTEYGILAGRDCIYLDEVSFCNRTNRLHLKGEINGSLCSIPPAGYWVPYELIFEGVLIQKITGLDIWTSQQNNAPQSSFDEIENPPWLDDLSNKKTWPHRHFILHTYDDVFEVSCLSFKMVFGEPRN